MISTIESIQSLYSSIHTEPPARIEKLPQSGSDRSYFRIHAATGKSIIVTGKQMIYEFIANLLEDGDV